MRLRFAPSPTGYLHIGNARTAIVNYLIAKKNSGTLVLRIEDTDLERSSKESEQSIMKSLQWLGIKWNEGPDIGGNYGPYRQSERLDIYASYTKKLLESRDAYRCFCGKEETDDRKKEAESANIAFKDPCRDISPDESDKKAGEGKPFAVRFRIPENEIIRIKDHSKGLIEFNSNNIGGDFVIVRSDGMPVYNYIVVIDDALMKISHVIRGEDHLSNTPKQILIAKSLGLPVPEYAHLALVVGQDRSKLSKRHGITSVDLYRDEGYLPEALVNYLGMLGWATETGEEILSIDQISAQIEHTNLAKSAAVFDFQKLKWMNGIHIRNYPEDKLPDLFAPFMEKAGYHPVDIGRDQLTELLKLAKNNCELLSDIGKAVGMFLDEIPEFTDEANTLLTEPASRNVITAAYGIINEYTAGNFSDAIIQKVKESTKIGGKNLFHPFRAMITGSLQGPDLKLSIPIIGFDRCKKRIEYCYKHFCT